jgi:hypothetical protein
MRGILRLDAQQQDVVRGKVDVGRARDGWHGQPVRLVGGDELQAVLANPFDMARAPDQERVVSGSREMAAEAAADGARAKDHKSH